MITPAQTKENAKWLREYAAKRGLGPMDLMPNLRNVKYTSIVKWMTGTVPRKRGHTRALAAFRQRIEKPHTIRRRAVEPRIFNPLAVEG